MKTRKNSTNKTKRIAAMGLAVILLTSMFSTAIFAAEEDTETITEICEQTPENKEVLISDYVEPDQAEASVPETDDIDASEDAKTYEETTDDTSLAPLTVRFLDIGAGDCAVLECDGHYAMIDAGTASAKNGKVDKPELYPAKIGIEKFDYLILTHPHSDHIGKAPKVMKKYHCDSVIVSAYSAKLYNNIKKLSKKYGSEYRTAEAGEVYPLGDALIEILYVPAAKVSPSKGDHWDKENNSSIVLRVVHGEKVFLFMGDALVTEQQRVLENEIDVKCDVMKVPHHGRKNAYYEEFYEAAQPSITVVPTNKTKAQAIVLQALSEISDMYNLYKTGTVTVVSDGYSLTVE